MAEDVLVIRQMPGQKEPVRIAVSIQAAKNGRDNLALAPGDTVTVEQTPATVRSDVIRTFFRVAVGANVNLVLTEVERQWSGPSGKPLDRCLLQVVDGSLAGVIFFVPLLMGGRHALGQLVLTVLAVAAACGLGRSPVSPRRCRVAADAGRRRCCWPGWRSWRSKWFPLPPWLLARLSPRTADLLPAWGDARGDCRIARPLALPLVHSRRNAGRTGDFRGLCPVVLRRRAAHRSGSRTWSGCCAGVRLSAVGMAVFGIVQLLTGNGKFFWFYEHPFASTLGRCEGQLQQSQPLCPISGLGDRPADLVAARRLAPRACAIGGNGPAARGQPRQRGTEDVFLGAGVGDRPVCRAAVAFAGRNRRDVSGCGDLHGSLLSGLVG